MSSSYGQGVDITIGKTEVPSVRLQRLTLASGEETLVNILTQDIKAFPIIYIKGVGYLQYNEDWETFRKMGRPMLYFFIPVLVYNWNMRARKLIDQTVGFKMLRITQKTYDDSLVSFAQLNPNADLTKVDFLAKNKNPNPQFQVISELQAVNLQAGRPMWHQFDERKKIWQAAKHFLARFFDEVSIDAGRTFDSEQELQAALSDNGPGFSGDPSVGLPSPPTGSSGKSALGESVARGELADGGGEFDDDLPFEDPQDAQVIPPEGKDKPAESDYEDPDWDEAEPVGNSDKEINPFDDEDQQTDKQTSPPDDEPPFDEGSGDDDDPFNDDEEPKKPEPKKAAPKKAAKKTSGKKSGGGGQQRRVPRARTEV